MGNLLTGATSPTAPSPSISCPNMSPPPLSVGALVQLTGLQSRSDLNDRLGKITAALSPSTGRLTVRVLFPHLAVECVNIKPENLSPSPSPDPAVRVVRIRTTLNNTGAETHLPDLIYSAEASANEEPAQCPIIEDDVRPTDLLHEVAEKGWVEHGTELCGAFGLRIKCFARPYRSAGAMRNIIATNMTRELRSGDAPNTVRGEAVFVKLGEEGEALALKRNDVMRALYFLADLRTYAYPVGQSHAKLADCELERELFKVAIKECFPHYDGRFENDRMTKNGFDNYHDINLEWAPMDDERRRSMRVSIVDGQVRVVTVPEDLRD